MSATRRLHVIALAAGLLAVAPAAASASVALNGSFSTAVQKPNFIPCGLDRECGTIQLVGLGTADWVYVFGPTFNPNGRCVDVDGSLTITLSSHAGAISGPLTGNFCPRQSPTAHEHAGLISYGNPFVEDDLVTFTSGTGRFAGLSGTATFHTFSAGARFTGTLNGT